MQPGLHLVHPYGLAIPGGAVAAAGRRYCGWITADEGAKGFSMARLQQTEGLTDDQQELLKLVRQFVDEQIIPNAQELEHSDTYPSEIVEAMKEMGVFGLMIPEEYGGLGESLLTYALCVEEIARGWMSVSGIINTHFIVAYMLIQHGTEEQKLKYLPRMAAGEVRGAFSMSEPGCGSDVSAIKTKAPLRHLVGSGIVTGHTSTGHLLLNLCATDSQAEVLIPQTLSHQVRDPIPGAHVRLMLVGQHQSGRPMCHPLSSGLTQPTSSSTA